MTILNGDDSLNAGLLTPAEFGLGEAYPNQFNPRSVIYLALKKYQSFFEKDEEGITTSLQIIWKS